MHRRLAAIAVALVAVATGCSSADPQPAPSDSPTAHPSASPTTASTPELAPGVYSIDCGADEHSPSAVVVLSADQYRVGGWNHVNGVGSFATVALEPAAYAISANNYVTDPTCGGARTLSTVLAKKTYDWDRQHANGIESQFPGDELTFGQVDAIVIELRLDATRSVLPQAADYQAAYGDLLTAQQLAELDGGRVNLEVTLFGADGAADGSTMNAGTIIEVDPAQFADGWVRVKVPRDRLALYTEKSYERSAVGAGDYQDLLVQGLRINPETSSGNEVRVYVGDAFDPRAKPELFKEMALTFAVIEIERSPR